MYLKFAVDVYFPTVITAASCDYDNTNQNQTLLMILVTVSDVIVHVL